MNWLTDIFAQHAWYWWIIVGFIAGLIAKAIMPGRDPGGWVATILIGIAGAVVSAVLGNLLLRGGQSGSDSVSLISAIVGALIILFLYRMLATRGSRTRTRV